jgi:glyceraldehyde-3-phosphate dehydrogenase/erythrose-4-phosphate dehydrogenase
MLSCGAESAQPRLVITKMIDDDVVKMLTWYDNGWGYVNQLVREVRAPTRPLLR